MVQSGLRGKNDMRSEESELVQLLKHGEEGAFEQIFHKYQEQVYNITYRMMGNPQEAEDMTQEAFLRVFQKIRQFKGKSAFSTWLYRLTVNLCQDRLRKLHKRKFHLAENLETLEENLRTNKSNILAVDEPTLEDKIILEDRRTAVQGIINALPANYRTIIILREIEGLSYKEIATVLDCSLGRVKSLLHDARQELKRRVEAKSYLFKEVV